MQDNLADQTKWFLHSTKNNWRQWKCVWVCVCVLWVWVRAYFWVCVCAYYERERECVCVFVRMFFWVCVCVCVCVCVLWERVGYFIWMSFCNYRWTHTHTHTHTFAYLLSYAIKVSDVCLCWILITYPLFAIPFMLSVFWAFLVEINKKVSIESMLLWKVITESSLWWKILYCPIKISQRNSLL